MSSYHYTILPCDFQSVSQWAPKFIDFRLNALKSEPKNTTSSYELESALSHQEWISTLCEPVFRVVLCVTRDTQENLVPVWGREWVGILCLYGPRYDQKTMWNNDVQSLWYIGAAFVCPLHRGQSILREIFAFGIQQATNFDMNRGKQQQGKASRYQTRIQVIAKASDLGALKYYRTGGLEITQTMTLGQFSKSGWNIIISADRLGMEIVVMERIIEGETEVAPRL